jgi:3',5'-cyclic-AMP phosphodiesterase
MKSMMKRLAWATDVHLNFLDLVQLEAFCQGVERHTPDALLLTGDISEAPVVQGHLRHLSERLRCPLYFVLGNHDFYKSGITRVREAMAAFVAEQPGIVWLTGRDVVPVTEETALVGHDSWADGRLGKGSASVVMMNDFFQIQELAWLSTEKRFARLAALGDEAAAHFRRVLPLAFERYKHVVLLTHVPPFREACRYKGRPTHDEFLPHVCNKAVGDVLREEMRARPDADLTVLCGHTHGRAYVEILPNLRVKTGEATYGQPAVEEVLSVS